MIHYVDYNGELVSESEYCRRKRLNYVTVRTRMKRHNETFEQAIHYYEENDVKPNPIYLIDCDGELVPAKEYCRRKHLNYEAVKNRVKNHKETYKQAIKYYEESGKKPKLKRGVVKDKRFYDIWRGMIFRCTSQKCPTFETYSKLGIQDSWLDFENFQDDMYEEYLKCLDSTNDLPSIDRKNNDIGYFKENCHWIPIGKQARNKHNNVWANEDELLIDYCERKGLRYDIIKQRMSYGYTLEEAESIPIPKYNGKNLKYIGKNIREFNVLKLNDIVPSQAIVECSICNAKIKLELQPLLSNRPNRGCFCRKGHKFYIGNNNYTYKELETLYNLSHEDMRKVIDSGDMSLFNDIVNLTNDEWIKLLKNIHNRW